MPSILSDETHNALSLSRGSVSCDARCTKADGKVGKICYRPDSEDYVRLRWADGTDSRFNLTSARLVRPSKTEQQEYDKKQEWEANI